MNRIEYRRSLGLGRETAMPSKAVALKFRKRPVIIEAMQFNGYERMFNAAWGYGAFDITETFSLHGKAIHKSRGGDNNGVLVNYWIDTLEGRMLVTDGDWVIRGVKGECYPCKPDIFAATYEPVP